MRRLGIIIKTLFVTLALVVAVVLALVYAGAYNVAATDSHSPLVAWLLHTTYQESVELRARDIEVPALDERERILRGARHFDATCQVCHTPPGQSPTAVSQGLNPEPPDLKRMLAGELEPAGAFWVINHGLRMTGMPAFGPTHDDEAIWDMVAFIQHARDLSPQAYRQLMSQASQAGGHTHDNGHETGASGDAHESSN